MSESPVMRTIQLEIARERVHLFRNNVGNGYVGKFLVKLPNGDAVLRDWRRIQFGLCPGSADLIGWRSLTITPDMVGKTIAQLVAVEVKTEDGSPNKTQREFLTVVRNAGGIACIARSVEDVLSVLR